jgi:hypothetical protein
MLRPCLRRAIIMDDYRRCEHLETTRGAVCPVCLRTTWKRAAAAIEQAIITRQARIAAITERQRGRPGRTSAADPGDARGDPMTAAGAADDEPASLEYVLPPLEDVLKLTRCWPPGPPPPERGESRIYVWGYGPLPTDLFQRPAEPTAAAREFAAAHGWDATRPDAWALELVLPLPLSRALGMLEPAMRRDPVVRGWGGRSGGRHQPAPRATLDAAVNYCRTAQMLCQRAQMLSHSAALACTRQGELMRHVRAGRLERLKRLPAAEFEALNRTLTAALDLGKAGRRTDGYTLLLSRWHEASAAAEQGVPWSGSLRWIYGVALQNYAWRYGPSLQ